MPAPHHSVFYRPDAFPAAQPTSKHRQNTTKQINKTYIPSENFENRVTIKHLCESHISKTCDYVITDAIYSRGGDYRRDGGTRPPTFWLWGRKGKCPPLIAHLVKTLLWLTPKCLLKRRMKRVLYNQNSISFHRPRNVKIVPTPLLLPYVGQMASVRCSAIGSNSSMAHST